MWSAEGSFILADLFNVKLPDALVQSLRDIHAHADAWLSVLNTHIQQCEERWQIRVTGLVPDLSHNVVAFAEGSDGAPYILKLSPPNAEFSQEVAALKLYNGEGICRLIDADDAVGAMLLERLEPGISLWRTEVENAKENDLATRAAATLMLQLWRPVSDPRPFRSLASWSRVLPQYLRMYPNGGGPLPHSLLKNANDLLSDLVNSSNPVLLHADLHHGNIASATRQPYLAIDPKGILGPRGYDLGPFLMNPTPRIAESNLRGVLERRVAIFGEMLDLDTREVAAWGLVHAALSACWTLENHGSGWEVAMKVAGELEPFL